MAYLRLADPIFDRSLSLRDAYILMQEFIVQYNARGESSTVALMTDVGTTGHGTPSDPAQIYDFLRVAGSVLRDEALTTKGRSGSAA